VTVFGAYSQYYDLLYRDKDYAAEVLFIRQLLERHAPLARTLLDLGCGTGAHAVLLAEAGYDVFGVDRSERMLEGARARRSRLSDEVSRRTEFVAGDIRTVSLDRRFDVVLSLFHVISYLPANADLSAAFSTVRRHLNPGGLFLFDCWYGPAVLSDPPAPRRKQLEDEQVRICRLAEPTLHANDNLVDVAYRMIITDKSSLRSEELNEMHRMRYLFKPELDLLLSAHGLGPVAFAEWMTGNEPSTASWNVVLVARLQG
jgi:SAM-dependent methyltransferase